MKISKFTIDIDGTINATYENGNSENIGTYQSQLKRIDLYCTSKNQYKISLTLDEIEQLSIACKNNDQFMDELFR